MRYRVNFAGERVGQSACPPFEIDTPDHLATSERTADLARHIRTRIVATLTAAPPPGAETSGGIIAGNTQVLVNLDAGQGHAYYGTSALGRFDIYPIN